MDNSGPKIIRTQLLAAAAMLQVEGEIKLMEAAAIRRDVHDVILHRARANAHYEAWVDLKLSAIHQVADAE